MERRKFYNLCKKSVSILVCGVLLSFGLFARDVTEVKVEKMDSWQEKFDINDKKGKYNVMVTATDQGGNTTVGGPFNIFIDPKSDLPICRITNPVQNMRVPGNLNIVGTCADDDAVSYVELILDGDSDNPVRATGKEFWSYFLNTEQLSEGFHTIEVYGVDVNGLKGLSVNTTWCLDRQQPVTEVTNMGIGTIVSGNVSFAGVVSDGNGIKAMSYSLDNGEHFTDVKVSNNKKTNTANFKFSIDTKKMKEGPAVIWFKATDTQGSVGYYSFLCFIDNTDPKVEIVYPAEKQVENGTFTAAGSAKDAIGLKSLTWEFNGEKGEFEIIPGNPYWTKEFKSDKGIKSGKLVITATDTAGNVTKKERAITINPELDKPLVSIQWPKAGSSLKEGEYFVRGIASDDDAVEKVRVTVDGTEVAVIETRGVFCALITDEKMLSYGKHNVSVSAVDVNGVVGNEVKSDYFCSGTKPKFAEPILKGGTDAGAAPFGTVVNPEGGSVFEIDAISLCGIKSASYSIEWSADRFGVADSSKKEETNIDIKSAVQKQAFVIPVETLPWGIVHLNFTVTDTLDRVSTYSACLYVKNLSRVVEKPSADLTDSINDEKAVVKVSDVAGSAYKRGMNVTVPSLSKSAAARWNKGKNLAEKHDPVGINLEITSELKDLTLSYKLFSSVNAGENPCGEGKPAIVRPDKNSGNGTAFISLEGIPAGMTTVVVSAASGKDYTASFTLQVAAVREMDGADINDDRMGQWLSTDDTVWSADSRAFVMGEKKRLCGIANLDGEVSAQFMARYPGLELSVEGKAVVITATEGGVYRDVIVRATDSTGARVDFTPVTIIADIEGPSFTIQRPTVYEWVRERLQISGTANDASGIASVEYSIDGGENWKSLGAPGRKLSAQLWAEENISGREDGLITIDIRATDISGHTSYYRSAVHKDTKAPDVTVVVPGVEEVVNGKNAIAFIAKDEGYLNKVQYVNINTGVRTDIERNSMVTTFVGTPEQPINRSMRFDFIDEAGNVKTLNSWEFVIDNQSDLPVATIQLPTEDQVITKDFVISGVVLDDDGPCKVFYKIDNGRYTEVEGEGYSFKVDVPLNSMTDNEHTITVYGIDINGARGPEFVRKFRVSLEEPVGRMVLPKIETTQSKIVTISGTASDRNGISKVEISLDNGNSWNETVGKENWTYTFDSRVLPDGTHVVFLRTTDGYGIESIFSSLINIDNTKPELALELPLDDSKTTGPVFFSGFTIDNIGLTELYISVTSLDGKYVNSRLARTDLTPDKIITTTVDLSSLENGRYNVQLTGKDAAGNESSVSRNITLDKRVAEADVNIYYPLNGEHKNGEFNIYGEVITTRNTNSVSLIMDGKAVDTAELSATGYFKFKMNAENLTEGKHTYRVRASLEGNMTVESINQTVDFKPYGPWITIENFNYGDFAIERPYIKGNAGYTIGQEEIDAARAKNATKEQKEALAAKSLSYVEISLDNGRTFTRLGNKKQWKYRVENEDMPEGYHFLLVRAVFKNGESAINRCIVQIDKTAPYVKMIAPSIGGHYNQSLEFSGLASDAVGLNSVTLALRKGDKAGYEVPSFIQGLYIDASFWGATMFSVGAGLSFFDDNVKLQVQWGQFTQAQREIFSQTQMRYGGNVLGAKLLANIAYIPFRSMFGPDWDWLSMGIALGANFSVFFETASGKPQVLSAVLGQIEFPRVTFKKAKCFRTISLYSEFQLWFIPSDVTSGAVEIKNLIFQFSEGIRVNIF
ncbi:Ig-like domain-containing protein [Treponema sp.]|uniref:Ig-like domain-containing protein n=1 Tax=Treponema sp. TaxID=166 RepID=UPI00298EA035|nr:Ig-like domain-containing protein [Treponema sp.]MCR5612963.1 Ig-like domain repeat protein [Treponema sp.]